jgi:hypothetical protein
MMVLVLLIDFDHFCYYIDIVSFNDPLIRVIAPLVFLDSTVSEHAGIELRTVATLAG